MDIFVTDGDRDRLIGLGCWRNLEVFGVKGCRCYACIC